jgi:23S rRNA U2552 (ribose-2'-O)-methylase RlmE/FtsJ
VYGILTDIEKIISDMAPNFSGELSTDHIDIVKLNIIAMTVALVLLKKGGNIVMKTLNG